MHANKTNTPVDNRNNIKGSVEEMDELIVKSNRQKSGENIWIYWGDLDIETIQIQEHATGMHVKTIEVADLNSKFAFEGLKPGLYTVELKINGKGNVTKIMRIL